MAKMCLGLGTPLEKLTELPKPLAGCDRLLCSRGKQEGREGEGKEREGERTSPK